MKKILIALFTLTILATPQAFAQKKEGEIVEKISSTDGTIIRTANYKAGVLVGPYKEIFEKKGTIKSSGQYKDGKKDGPWEYGKADGKKTLAEVYENGEATKKTVYFANGNVAEEADYKDGKRNGITKKYSTEGELKSETAFENGKQHGKEIVHVMSTNGSYTTTTDYKNGKKDGEYLEKYTNGNLKTKGQYANDNKNGFWVYGNAKGELLKEETFENGKSVQTKKL
ncbi:MAG: toxin-antitoxin system YwqK family antitoxin [Puniceicoccales bacterium]|jgi:antitoxin component YwqK of YwqJK toxin-antitoxin module|nr:toxin-antitoxin system YwqK family antitoxin [Puniceicoccales bacterium]